MGMSWEVSCDKWATGFCPGIFMSCPPPPPRSPTSYPGLCPPPSPVNALTSDPHPLTRPICSFLTSLSPKCLLLWGSLWWEGQGRKRILSPEPWPPFPSPVLIWPVPLTFPALGGACGGRKVRGTWEGALGSWVEASITPARGWEPRGPPALSTEGLVPPASPRPLGNIRGPRLPGLMLASPDEFVPEIVTPCAFLEPLTRSFEPPADRAPRALRGA